MKKILLYIFLLSLFPKSNLSMGKNIFPAKLETDLFYIWSGLCAAQVISIILLKKNGMFFGKKIMPPVINFNNQVYQFKPYGLVSVTNIPNILTLYPQSLIHAACFYYRKHLEICFTSENKFPITIILSGLGIINLINLAHNDSLKALKENIRTLPLEIKSKIKFDQEKLSNLTCIICHDTPNIDPINPCDTEDHVFCRTCLKDWFSKIHENKSDDNYEKSQLEEKFACLLCTKEIKPDNKKVEIYRVGKKLSPSIKNILWQLAGINGVIIIIYGAIIYIALIEKLQA